MKTAEYYIEELEMLPHVEGGYFKESFYLNTLIILRKNFGLVFTFY